MGQFLVYEAEDGRIKIDVRLENETVWLTQRLMAELFQKDVRTINEHIQNVYEERELEPEATIRKFRIVQKEGARDVTRMVDFFKTVQNKMHWAITGKTAAEIVHSRADADKANMGLTNWRDAKVRKQDVAIAKNYLDAGELAALNNRWSNT